MIRKNHFLPRLFDSFSYLGPKARKQLEHSWAETFRRHILPKLPVEKLGKSYRKGFGRPSKNLHTGLGVLVLQQMLDTTDEETVQRLSFDTRWQYALNITGTKDEDLYMCERTLRKFREKAVGLGIEEELFAIASEGLVAAGGVDVGRQRMDSVHVKSNMKRLGRLRLVGRTIQAFLKNLRRKEKGAYDRVGEEVRKRYVELLRGEEIFSQVKPSETAVTLSQAAQDLSELVEQFAGEEAIGKMTSYRTMERVLREQCRVMEEEGTVRVEVKGAKEVGADSLQNPSDPDAGYSGHKGQGYTVQMMETFSTEEGSTPPRLITYVEVTSAAVTDHHAIEGAMQAVEERGVKPELLLADTLYGSDDNVAKARDHGVELVSPVNSQEGKSGHMPLSAFRVNAEDVIVECPGGQTPQRVKQEKEKVTVWFERKICEGCVHKEACPVLWSKKRIRLPYELKSMRSSRRRQAEDGPEFREKYRWRSGIESAFSEWDRRTGVKHLRVRGRKAVRFCVFLKALGLNILRYTAWVIEGGKELAPDPGKGSSRGLVGFGKDLLLNFHNRNSLLKAFSIRIWLDKIPGCVQAAAFLTMVMGCLFF